MNPYKSHGTGSIRGHHNWYLCSITALTGVLLTRWRGTPQTDMTQKTLKLLNSTQAAPLANVDHSTRMHGLVAHGCRFKYTQTVTTL